MSDAKRLSPVAKRLSPETFREERSAVYLQDLVERLGQAMAHITRPLGITVILTVDVKGEKFPVSVGFTGFDPKLSMDKSYDAVLMHCKGAAALLEEHTREIEQKMEELSGAAGEVPEAGSDGGSDRGGSGGSGQAA